MIGGTVINIDILVGLPGSGKTYYSEHLSHNAHEYFHVVDFDEYRNVYPGLGTLLRKHYAYDEVFLYNSKCHLVFDGLFLTRDSQDRLVQEWFNLFDFEDKQKQSKTNIKFIFFKENRNACLKNDSFRDKERSAKGTIKGALLERPDIEYFKTRFNDGRFTFEIEEKEVYEMNNYEGTLKPLRDSYWSSKLGYDTMTSDSWRTGGKVCSYDGWENEVKPEKQPQEFTKFDDLLEKYCPNISFLTYKKIYGECVTVKDGYENDYYGGTTYYSLYCCNLERLYDMLKERGYLTEKEE